MLEKIFDRFRGNRIYPILAAAAVVVALVGGSVAVRLLSRSDTPQSLPTSSTSAEPSRAGQPSATATPAPSESPTADPPITSATTTSGGGATTPPPTNGSTTPGTPSTPTTPAGPTTQTTTGTQTSTGTTPPATPDWVPLWSQEFGGSTLPDPFYADICPSHVTVSGGLLRLDVPSDASCLPRVRHNPPFLQDGMAVEVRARVIAPPSGSLTARILLIRPSGDVGVPIVDMTGTGYRIYRAELAGSNVTWYIDGQVVQSGNIGSILGIAVTGATGLTETVTAVEVDYVRVYQRSS